MSSALPQVRKLPRSQQLTEAGSERVRSGLGDGPIGTAVCTASQPSDGTLVHFGLAFFAASRTVKRWKPLRTFSGSTLKDWWVSECFTFVGRGLERERERETNKHSREREGRKTKDEREKERDRKRGKRQIKRKKRMRKRKREGAERKRERERQTEQERERDNKQT